MEDPDTLLTERDLSRMTGRSLSTIRKDRIAGASAPAHIPFLKLGHLVRYRRADVLAFLARQVRTSTSDPGAGADRRAPKAA